MHSPITCRFGNAAERDVPVIWYKYDSDTLPVTLVSSGINRLLRFLWLYKMMLPALVRFGKLSVSSEIIV